MADSQTTSVTTVGPTLFTHDGYRLYVFDGEPCMFDEDLGTRLGFTRGRDVRKLIKRQEANLEIIGNLRRGVAKEKGTRGRPAVSYYLTQQQTRWVVIKSEAPEADVLLRQLLSVFDAWERGELVSRAEAAEAALARQSAASPAGS